MRFFVLSLVVATAASASLSPRQGVDPWTAAIGSDKCTTQCSDKVIVCSTGQCSPDSAEHKEMCTTEGYNKIVACGNCVVSNGVITAAEVNGHLNTTKTTCGDSLKDATASVTAAGSVSDAATTSTGVPPAPSKTVSSTPSSASTTKSASSNGAGPLSPAAALLVVAAALAAAA